MYVHIYYRINNQSVLYILIGLLDRPCDLKDTTTSHVIKIAPDTICTYVK